MKELYYVKRERKSLRTLRLEFGEVKNKFLLKFIDGEINLKGRSEFSPIEEVFDELKKGGISGWLKLSINNQPFKKDMPPWIRIAF